MTEYYCDGAGWNGIKSRYCVIICEGIKEEVIHEVYNEEFTNNEMEYRAVNRALLASKDGDTIYTDSQLVQKQILGEWKINYDHLKVLCEQANVLREHQPNTKIKWVNRNKNLAGIWLERN